MHRVGVLQVVGDDGVAHLVVGGDPALLLAHHPGLLLRAGDHAHDPLLQLEVVDLALALAGREQGGLVDQVLQVGAREARRLGGQVVQVDDLGQRLAAGVHLEDLGPALAVGAVHHDLAVEAARAQQRGVQDVGPVGGGDQDDVVGHREAVHLHQELVERLLALVVTAAQAGATVAPDGVDLVHEDDAGVFCLACSKRSRTREAPTPTNISTKSEPEMEKKGTPASPATARASRVLPVPGGP